MAEVPPVLAAGTPQAVAALLAFAKGIGARATGAVVDAAAAPDAVAAAVARSARERGAGAVLVAQGPAAEDLAPRVAGALGAACAPGCTALAWAGDRWTLTRGIHGGALAGAFASSGPLVASLDLRAVAPAAEPLPDGAAVSVLDVGAAADGTRVLRRDSDAGDDVPLESASRIGAGGRGVGGPQGFAVLGRLAAALGAGLASSRPPCDAGWVPSSRQVGITGRKVAPEAYVAVGISGSVQHLAGMCGSRLVAAVNRDPEAPIFGFAHLGVVGDWAEVVAGMLDVLDARAAGGRGLGAVVAEGAAS